MINSASTRDAAHHVDSLLLHILLIDLRMGILIFTHNDGGFVDPQNKNLIELCHLFKAVLLERDVKVGFIGLIDDVYHCTFLKKLIRAKVKKEDQFRPL